MRPEEFAALCQQGGTNHFPAGWQYWEVAQVAHRQMFTEAAASAPAYPGGFGGRGIVIGAGGPTYFPCAYVCVSVLRELGCTLPVEFWHLGPEEIDEEMARLVAPLGVTCRDARQVVPRPRRLAGWELKPFSVIHSAFREVLYLDADNVPVLDPTYLFEERRYRECGAVFWPDPPTDEHAVRTLAWDVAGIAGRDEPAFESGQYLIDKSRCWPELRLTMHLNEHSDFWYHYVYGDKDTFKLAWHKLGRRYAMPAAGAGWIWPAILQYDLDGRLLFTHACQGKGQLRRGVRLGTLPQADAAVRAAVRLNGLWAPRERTLTVETITPQEFARRYGELDTSRALHCYTPAHDTHAVLTLLAHVRPRRVLEIGTALGHMTANLTEWSPDDALVYTIGIVQGMEQFSIAEQRYEVPSKEELGKFTNHFGKASKVIAVVGDSLQCDFTQFAPLDFAFIDGAHDKAHVLGDTRNAYSVLRPGGCIVWHDFTCGASWLEVRQALAEAALPEPITHIEGSAVAFLIKQGGKAAP
jgi:predicted O-methyltransferase YrrM